MLGIGVRFTCLISVKPVLPVGCLIIEKKREYVAINYRGVIRKECAASATIKVIAGILVTTNTFTFESYSFQLYVYARLNKNN